MSRARPVGDANRLDTLEHEAERTERRLGALEEKVAVLVRSVAALNRELAELRFLLADRALAAEHDLQLAGREDGDGAA